MRNFWSKHFPTFASSGQVGSWETIESSSFFAISETIFRLPVSLVVPNLAYKASKLDLKPVISALVKLTGTGVTVPEPEGAGLGLVEAAADPEGAGLADDPGLGELVVPPPPPPPPPPPVELLPDGLGEDELLGDEEAVAETHLLFSHLLEAQSLLLSQADPVVLLPPEHLLLEHCPDWHSVPFVQASPPFLTPVASHLLLVQLPDWQSEPLVQDSPVFLEPVEEVPSHLVVEFESEGTKA